MAGTDDTPLDYGIPQLTITSVDTMTLDQKDKNADEVRTYCLS